MFFAPFIFIYVLFFFIVTAFLFALIVGFMTGA